jgi:prevent-host-death family protein
MRDYTFSEARQNFASVLENAQKEGAVRITHRDGRTFTIQPVQSSESPLAVKGVKLELSRDAIVAAVRESRERAGGG